MLYNLKIYGMLNKGIILATVNIPETESSNVRDAFEGEIEYNQITMDFFERG